MCTSLFEIVFCASLQAQPNHDIDEEREKLDARMEAREARLRSQFLYNDAIIQTLNSTLDFVQQQFDAMNGNNDN